MEQRPSLIGYLGAVWGLLGVYAFIGSAVWRLGQIGWEALQSDLLWYHWAFLGPWVLFMGVSEGYRGFQKKFSPRVAARARYLSRHPRPLHLLLAPAFCMGYFFATRRRLLTSWILTLGLVCLVLLVRQLPVPWRGLVDVGVVFGLAWGLTALAVFVVQAFTRAQFDVDPEVPEHAR